MSTFQFSPKGQNGQIPQIGLGTATLKGQVGIDAVATALDVGYRFIDTALLYENQVEVGEAIKKSSVPRDQIFVTSKVGFFPENSEGVWMYNANNVKGQEAESIDLSLKQLQLDYVDLILLHNPCVSVPEYNAACLPHFFELFNETGNPLAVKPVSLPGGLNLRATITNAKRQEALQVKDATKSRELRMKSWKALELAREQGKCKYIGVSNFTAELLLEMQEYAQVMPAINQLELHPKYSSPKLRKVAAELGVVLIGYGTGNFALIEKNPKAEEIAKRLGKTVNQVLLRWTTQSGVVVIPRSRSRDHLIENLDLNSFTLSGDDMQTLNGLNEDYPYYWDPLPTNDTLSK